MKNLEKSELFMELEEEYQEAANPYVKYEIMTYPSDYTLSVIVDMYKNGDIIIPDYQRNYVWSIKQASLLIDSFLMGLPVPPIFVYIDEESKNVVIDGQQRLMSIIFYFDGYFGSEESHQKRVFRLTGLAQEAPHSNKKFNELTTVEQRKLKQSILRFINIKQTQPEGEVSSAYYIFERLNTGGTPLKPQEIRNCIYRGELNEILKDINKNKYWRNIISRKKLDKHQRDVEMILRVFSFSYFHINYEKPMKEFLNKIMKRNKNNINMAKDFKKKFESICRKVVISLPEKPFHLKGPINVSFLDSFLSGLIINFDKVIKILKEEDILKIYNSLKEDREYLNCISSATTDEKHVECKMKKVLEKVSQALEKYQ